MKPLHLIAGMDEVGRGAWAGPVFAAAVILPKKKKINGLKDSKELSAKKRESLSKEIEKYCQFGLGSASSDEVDALGLSKATELAFLRAFDALKVIPDEIWIDGINKFNFPVKTLAFVKGDKIHACISAASILAKVHRDEWMKSKSENFTHYAFEKHKGYGTRLHKELLLKHGASSLHRKTYKPIREIINSHA